MKRSIKQVTGEFIEHETKQVAEHVGKHPAEHTAWQSFKRSMRSAKQFALRAAALFTACGLLTGCAAQGGFVRTAPESRSNDSVRVPIGTNTADSSSAGGNCFFNEEECAKLRALQWDGYEEMSVFDYQNAVRKLTDTWEYQDLLERLSKDEVFYEGRDDDETAAFFFYVVEPLTSGDSKWRTRRFGGCAVSDRMNEYPTPADQAMLEFVITLTVLNEKNLTVGEYNDARLGMTGGMKDLLYGRTDEELQDEMRMRDMIDKEVEHLTEQWGSDGLEIAVEYAYMPLSVYETNDEARNGNQQWGGQDGNAGDFGGQSGNPDGQGQERRQYPNGTPEDYRSLLTLKTPDYQEMCLADFNKAVLEWMNEDYERAERINCDAGWNDFAVPLTEEEWLFVTLSVNLSGMENAKSIQSHYMGRTEEDPVVNQYLPQKTAEVYGRSAWCDLFYQFSYHIMDKEALTVGERDRIVGGMMNTILEFWEVTEPDALLAMREKDIAGILQDIAAAYSTEQLTISIYEDWVSFECMDERILSEEQNSLQEPLSQEYVTAYERLLKYKTEDYLQQSVAEFNASIAPTRDAFGEALEEYSQVVMEGISKEDENYDFFDVTLGASLSELYGEVFEEPAYFPVYLSRKERPYAYMGPTGGDLFYEFDFSALVNIEYCVTSKKTLTVAERDRVLRACREELQSYVDDLSEEQILHGNIWAMLTRKAAELAYRYSGNGMELSIEIGLIDMFCEE